MIMQVSSADQKVSRGSRMSDPAGAINPTGKQKVARKLKKGRGVHLKNENLGPYAPAEGEEGIISKGILGLKKKIQARDVKIKRSGTQRCMGVFSKHRKKSSLLWGGPRLEAK